MYSFVLRGARPSRPPFARLLPPVLLASLAGCATYEPAPLNPTALLARLDTVELASDADARAPGDLAAFALRHNPALRELRAQLAISDALLIEAGVLPDVELSWDAMDVVGARADGETATTGAYVSGFGLSIPLLAPGERGARRAAAERELDLVRAEVAAAEWRVAAEVAASCARVRAAMRAVEREAGVVDVARRTASLLEAAADRGAATALEVSLARGALAAARADALAREAGLAEHRLALNELLGLPPGIAVAVAESDAPGIALDAGGVGALVERAIAERPDVRAAEAAYRVAEADLALAFARRRPRVSVGTAVALAFDLFGGFRRASVDVALARRERARAAFETKLFDVRAEVHAALARRDAADRARAFARDELAANAERSRELAQRAFDAGTATLLEVLAVQREGALAARVLADSEAAADEAAWRLAAACGALVTPKTDQETARTARTSPVETTR